MIDFPSLIKNTVAYKSVLGDKKGGRLSHAYLVIDRDGENLEKTLEIFAKVLACDEVEPCNTCRVCRGIQNKSHADVYFYPKLKTSLNTEEVNELIEETFIRPIETSKKIFVINHGETLSQIVQNKLLKTLEEPPKNVHILIGATSEYPLLQTVKSRLKKLEIPQFSDEALFNAMQSEFADKDKLMQAIACGDGTIGRAQMLYGEPKFQLVTDFVLDMAVNMQSSKDVLDFSDKLFAVGCDFSEVLTSMENYFRDALAYQTIGEKGVKNKNNLKAIKIAQGYTAGSLVAILEDLNQANLRSKFNPNPTMLAEWVLFKILEEKHKWLKL